jgi:hypothetical protein
MKLFNNKRIFRDKGTYDDKHLYKGVGLFGRKPRDDGRLPETGPPGGEMSEEAARDVFVYGAKWERPDFQEPDAVSPDVAAPSGVSVGEAESGISLSVATSEPDGFPGGAENEAAADTVAVLFAAGAEGEPAPEEIAPEEARIVPVDASEVPEEPVAASEDTVEPVRDAVVDERPPAVMTPLGKALRVGGRKKRFVGSPSYADADIIKVWALETPVGGPVA